MSIEEIALRLIESDCSTDYYFKILDELGNNTTKIQELEKEKLHIEIAYEEDYKEQQQEIERLGNELQVQIEDNVRLNEYLEEKDKEIERLNNIINELEKYCNEEIKDYDKALNNKVFVPTEKGKESYEAEKMCFLDMLDKLQELKGSNSNE